MVRHQDIYVAKMRDLFAESNQTTGHRVRGRGEGGGGGVLSECTVCYNTIFLTSASCSGILVRLSLILYKHTEMSAVAAVKNKSHMTDILDDSPHN